MYLTYKQMTGIGMNHWVTILFESESNRDQLIKMLTLVSDLIPQEEFQKSILSFDHTNQFENTRQRFEFIEGVTKNIFDYVKLQSSDNMQKCNINFMKNHSRILVSAIVLIALSNFTSQADHNSLLQTLKEALPLIELQIIFHEPSAKQRFMSRFCCCFNGNAVTKIDDPHHSALASEAPKLKKTQSDTITPIDGTNIVEKIPISDDTNTVEKKSKSQIKEEKKKATEEKKKAKKEEQQQKKNKTSIPLEVAPVTTTVPVTEETLVEKIEDVLVVVEKDAIAVEEVTGAVLTAVLTLMGAVAETVVATQESVQAIQAESQLIGKS